MSTSPRAPRTMTEYRHNQGWEIEPGDVPDLSHQPHHNSVSKPLCPDRVFLTIVRKVGEIEGTQTTTVGVIVRGHLRNKDGNLGKLTGALSYNLHSWGKMPTWLQDLVRPVVRIKLQQQVIVFPEIDTSALGRSADEQALPQDWA